MKFPVKARQKKDRIKYNKKDFEIARLFTERLYKEFGTFIRAVVLFGSVAKRKQTTQDIDILVVLDDLKIKFSDDVVQTYRVILEKIIANIDPQRLHIQSMKFTSFWEYARVGDPVAINILRYGVALIDTGFFDPLQALLDDGKIRPSKEAVYTYFTMAPASLHKARQHTMSAVVDMYWAVIDASHAMLMELGEIPPTPEHVADLLDMKMVKKGLLKKSDANIMRKFYKLFKDITHRQIKEVKGKDYDKLMKEAEYFVNVAKRFLEKRK
ncbi:MAG: nucleotidyltransferase domain-containing protein [archaeon]